MLNRELHIKVNLVKQTKPRSFVGKGCKKSYVVFQLHILLEKQNVV